MIDHSPMAKILQQFRAYELLLFECLQKCHTKLEVMRHEFVVRIEKSEIVATPCAYARVSRFGKTPIFLANEPNARVDAGEQRHSVIRGTIVHHNQLPILKALGLNTPDRAHNRIG